MNNADVQRKFDVPIEVMSNSSRAIFSKLLNPIKLIPTKENITRDWRGLSGLLGFSSDHVTLFASTNDPTGSLLKEWSTFEDSSIIKLLYCMQKMDRFDVIADAFDVLCMKLHHFCFSVTNFVLF